MTYTAEVLTDAPGWYPRLGEPSGSTVNDSSGNGRTGTYVAGGTLAQASLIQTDADTAWLAPSSGAGSASVVYGSWMNSASISIEAWTKSTSVAAGVLVCRDTQVGTRVWQLQRSAAGKVVFTVIAGANPSATSSASINDGNAHHVVVTYDGTTCKIYIDKVLDTTATLSQALPQPTSIGITIGNSARTITSPAAATMDEVAYYPGTILTGTRVTAHYDAATVVSATVTVPVASATAAAIAPTVGVGAGVTVPAAAASASATAPTISANATVTVPTATATAEALVPVIDVPGDATVLAPAAAATAEALPPTLTWSASVGATAATATADALAPTVSATANATVAVPTATASATAIAPAISNDSPNATVEVPTATATAAAPAPVVAGVYSSGTDTTNLSGGRIREATGAVTITRPVEAVPVSVGTRVDKALAYPTPTMVDGRPT